MKSKYVMASIGGLVAALVFMYGFMTAQYQIFPYQKIMHVKSKIIVGNRPTSDAAYVRKASTFEAFTRKVEVVMIGDSLTDGVEWADIFPTVRIANRGIAGDTIKGVHNRIDSITSLRADKAFIMIGINDLYGARSVAEIMSDYKSVVGMLRGAGTTVFIQSTVMCNEEINPLGKCAKINPNVKELNRQLENYARLEKLEFIDLNAVLSGPAGLKEVFTNDGIHLNGRGYVAWSAKIKSIMSERADALAKHRVPFNHIYLNGTSLYTNRQQPRFA